jgi:hypothetical protein
MDGTRSQTGDLMKFLAVLAFAVSLILTGCGATTTPEKPAPATAALKPGDVASAPGVIGPLPSCAGVAETLVTVRGDVVDTEPGTLAAVTGAPVQFAFDVEEDLMVEFTGTQVLKMFLREGVNLLCVSYPVAGSYTVGIEGVNPLAVEITSS